MGDISIMCLVYIFIGVNIPNESEKGIKLNDITFVNDIKEQIGKTYTIYTEDEGSSSLYIRMVF